MANYPTDYRKRGRAERGLNLLDYYADTQAEEPGERPATHAADAIADIMHAMSEREGVGSALHVHMLAEMHFSAENNGND